MLDDAIDELARVLDDRFLRTQGSRAEVLAAYAEAHDHRREDH